MSCKLAAPETLTSSSHEAQTQSEAKKTPRIPMSNKNLPTRESMAIKNFPGAVDDINNIDKTMDDTSIVNEKLEETMSQSTIDCDEVDTWDSSTCIIGPIHPSQTSSDTCARSKPIPFKAHLTLSAFRRPEHTIRLTDSHPGRKISSDYDLYFPGCGVIGHGAFSTVRLAVRKSDGVKVAVKSIAKYDALRSRRQRLGSQNGQLEEWDILRRFENQPYVINLLDVYETDDEIHLVTEYCRGGELFNAIQRKRNRANSMRRGQYSETQAVRITGQILRALVDLHAKGIVHRDVKPENILLLENDDHALRVKLCDFGMARSLNRETDMTNSFDDVSPITPERSRTSSNVGSDYYVAPEICYGRLYGTAVDMYSLGVTVYVLLCGFPPVFSGGEDSEVIFPDTYFKGISDHAKSLVRRMLTVEPEARITAREALKDPWITNNFVDTMPSVQRIEWDGATADPLPGTPFECRIDLDLVRSRLYRSLGLVEDDSNQPSSVKTKSTASVVVKKRRPGVSSINGNISKRTRIERRSNTSSLIALADLYRTVVPQPVVSAGDDSSEQTTPKTKNTKARII